MSKYDHTSLEQMMAQIRLELAASDAKVGGVSGDAAAPRLPMAEIMRRVRAEVAKRRSGTDGRQAPKDAGTAVFPHWQSAIPPLPSKKEYTLGELLAYSDLSFVSTVFQVVLRRKPSDGELTRYLERLRNEGISKIEIVGEIRWSREGVARGVHIDGLLVPYTLRKWERRPFVGPLLRWFHAFVKLGQGEHRRALEAARQESEIQILGETLNRVSSALGQWQNDLEGRLAELANSEATSRLDASVREVVAQQASLSTTIGAMRSRLEDIDGLLGKLDASEDVERLKNNLESLQAKMELVHSEFRLVHEQAVLKFKHAEAKYGAAVELLNQRNSALLQTQQRVEHIARALADMSMRQPLDAISKESKSQGPYLIETEMDKEQQLTALDRSMNVEHVSKAVDLDPFYVAFEDHFRGGRELVRQRAEPYLAQVREAGAGTREAPVLDVGCGRGEWLELLREHGLHARGIDLNRIFIEICRGHGLDVTEGDAINVLSSMPDNSVGAITSMHLVEHLPFEQLIIMLDEAYRVLFPGGLLLLETPNPENLSVGAHTFYLDPTHRNPIPPAALQWMVQARGFQNAVVERLTVARELNTPPPLAEDIPGASSINSLLAQFNIAPDYAVIAKKP